MGGIDLDPASSDVANRVVKATQFYSRQDDGFSHEWSGRGWMCLAGSSNIGQVEIFPHQTRASTRSPGRVPPG